MQIYIHIFEHIIIHTNIQTNIYSKYSYINHYTDFKKVKYNKMLIAGTSLS